MAMVHPVSAPDKSQDLERCRRRDLRHQSQSPKLPNLPAAQEVAGSGVTSHTAFLKMLQEVHTEFIRLQDNSPTLLG